MTDVLTIVADTDAVVKRKPAPPAVDGVDVELVARLVEQARSAGLQLTGEGGLLQQLTKRVIESALDLQRHLVRRVPGHANPLGPDSQRPLETARSTR